MLDTKANTDDVNKLLVGMVYPSMRVKLGRQHCLYDRSCDRHSGGSRKTIRGPLERAGAPACMLAYGLVRGLFPLCCAPWHSARKR